jgi:hypothetical protein
LIFRNSTLKMTRYQCPHCERVFSRRAALRNHAKTHDNIVDRVLREISEEVEEVTAYEQQEVSYEEEEERSDNDEQLQEVNYEEEEERSDNDEQLQEVNYEEEEVFEEEVRDPHVEIVYLYFVCV